MMFGIETGNIEASATCSTYQSIPDDQRQMASAAHHEFKQGNYAVCLEILLKLQKLRPQDVKVFHNMCVAEFYQSKCLSAFRMYENMLIVCKQSHIDEDIDLIDDVDQCVVFYNRAVLLYHLYKYDSAIDILDKVFQFVEPLDEVLALKICYLLIELYICTMQPKKALGVAAYVETTILSGTSKGNNSSKSTAKEIPERMKTKVVQYKASCYTMMKTFKPCKREVKTLMASGSPDQIIAGLFIKSQLEYFRNNHKKALRIINSVQYPENMSEAFLESGDLLKVMHCNNVACIHHSLGKYSLAAHYLHSAIDLFKKVQIPLRIKFKAYPGTQPLHTIRGDVLYQLAFNLGITYFKNRKFDTAFHALVKATDMYGTDPRLWLCIASCCIYIQEQSRENYRESNELTIVKQYVGEGIYKKAILNPCIESLSSSRITSESPAVSPTLSYAIHALRTAWLFLPDDPTSDGTKLPSTGEDKDVHHCQLFSSLPTFHSAIPQGEEVQRLRNKILLNSSYAYLRSGDVLSAYAYAMKLLSQQKISGMHQYLAHSYAGQALVALDRISEAVDHFNPDLITDVSTKVSNADEMLAKQSKGDAVLTDSSVNNDNNVPFTAKENSLPNLSDAKALAQYNLAVVYAIRGEWVKASQLLSKISPDCPAPIKDLRVFIDLCQGATDAVRSSLEQCLHSRITTRRSQ